MATSQHNDPEALTAPPRTAVHDAGVELLPFPTETPAEYLARLKALHTRVGALIDAIEQRRPVLGPVPARPPRAIADRRVEESADRRVEESADRRGDAEDRRIWSAEARPLPMDRRRGARDRRHLAVERREEQIERRRDPEPVPWQGGLRLDRTTLMWALQVAAWIAVAAIALVYGIGG